MLPSLILCLIKDDRGIGKWHEIEMNKSLQSLCRQFDSGRLPWGQFTSSCLFVLPMGNLSGLSLNIFHKLNVTFSFSSTTVSSNCFWTRGIHKAFSKDGSCETYYFKNQPWVTSPYFVTRMAGTGLSTNSIIAEHSSLAGISLTI